MLKKAISNTRHCRSGIKCLEPNGTHPRCSVDYAFGKNLMFLNSPSDTTCPYRMRFGDGYICDCPTHYAIESKRQPFIGDPTDRRAEVSRNPRPPAEVGVDAPQTVSEAVEMLLQSLSHEEQAVIAGTDTEDIGEVANHLVDHIRKACGLEADNRALYRSCSYEAGCVITHPDDAAAIVLAKLVQELARPRARR